jgi:intracellular multiplication protein IcmV
MPLKDAIKVTRKTFFNPTGWLGYDLLATQTRVLWRLVKNLFVMPEAGRAETFEQATERFKLSDEQVKEIAHTFRIYTFIFSGCGIITLLFSFYLIFYHGTFAGLIIGFATAAVFFAYAFRYSFWRFQIRHRTLGGTFQEWLHDKPKNEA